MSALSNIARQACKSGLIGVPLLLPVGLVLWLLWLAVSLMSDDGVDWSPVLWTWGGLFFLSAILGMFGGHWNRRIANWWQGKGRDAPRVSLILIMSATVPIAVFIVMVTRMRSDEIPGWLWVLAGLTTVLGIVTDVDQFRSTGRYGPAGSKRRQTHA